MCPVSPWCPQDSADRRRTCTVGRLQEPDIERTMQSHPGVSGTPREPRRYLVESLDRAVSQPGRRRGRRSRMPSHDLANIAYTPGETGDLPSARLPEDRPEHGITSAGAMM